MPRPFPGGKSTCVGNTSRKGELKVPTYAINGPSADCPRTSGNIIPTTIAATAPTEIDRRKHPENPAHRFGEIKGMIKNISRPIRPTMRKDRREK
jgi:hypothetical protein